MNETTTPNERATLIRFIESLRTNKPFQEHRNGIRVLNRGLFVDARLVDEVAKEYKSWIETESHGIAQKTIEKCKQRLFDGKEPDKQYLVEGKHVIVGFLIPIPLQNPQQFGLPFYLGSILSMHDYLHPADPVLQGISGLEVRSGRTGLEAVVSRGERKTVIPEGVIKAFAKQVENSRYLQRRYPEMKGALAGVLKFLVGIARRARVVPKSLSLIVPTDARNSKKIVRISGKFLLIEERGVLQRVIELNGRNLSTFLKDELIKTPKEKLGSFRVMPKHRDILGFYERREGRTSVHARAFSEFTEYSMRARDPREKFAGPFTAGESFERFSSFFQLSQPIEKRKIEGALKALRIEGATFRMYGGWIFALSRERTVMRAVAKHIRLPGQKRFKE